MDALGNVVGIVAAKLDVAAAKLKEPLMADRKFVAVVNSAQDAAVLVLVY